MAKNDRRVEEGGQPLDSPATTKGLPLEGPLAFFSGYGGRSPSPATTRLYLTLEFDSYIDVATADIVRTVVVTDPTKPLPQTNLWIRVGAAITHTALDSFTGPADFVRGEIVLSCPAGRQPPDLSQQLPQELALQRPGLSWFRCCRTESAHPSRRVCLCCPD